jgi:hypothetical protein
LDHRSWLLVVSAASDFEPIPRLPHPIPRDNFWKQRSIFVTADEEKKEDRYDIYPYITVVTEQNTTDRWRVFSQKSVPDCGKSPDYRAFSEDKIRTYSFSREVNVTCWTTPAVIPDSYQCGPKCDPGMNPMWFKTTDNCFIADYNVKLPSNFSVWDQLRFCPHPLRQDSRFREQYGTATYCYSCAALSCPSIRFDSKNQSIDLACWDVGETVRADEYVDICPSLGWPVLTFD